MTPAPLSLSFTPSTTQSCIPPSFLFLFNSSQPLSPHSHSPLFPYLCKCMFALQHPFPSHSYHCLLWSMLLTSCRHWTQDLGIWGSILQHWVDLNKSTTPPSNNRYFALTLPGGKWSLLCYCCLLNLIWIFEFSCFFSHLYGVVKEVNRLTSLTISLTSRVCDLDTTAVEEMHDTATCWAKEVTISSFLFVI